MRAPEASNAAGGEKMPYRPKHPCKHPGCGELVTGTYCDVHTPQPMDYRGSAASRGYGRTWQRESKAYLSRHPWCMECERKGKRTPATEVDHKKPHKGDARLFWDRDNWQGLCHRCHSIKTAKEDGGFGNRRPPRGAKFLKSGP